MSLDPQSSLLAAIAVLLVDTVLNPGVRALTLIIDGEVASYDEQLQSRFDWLREPDPNAVATPPVFMAFDRDGRDLSARPLRDRRARLEDVVAGIISSSPSAGSLLTAWRRGRKSLSAASRATWRRTR